MQKIVFLPCGDTAFAVQFGETISRELCMQVLRLKEAVKQAGFPGIVETVPTYRSLLVHYDPLTVRQTQLIEAIGRLTETPQDIQMKPKHWFLPICFEEEYAWDLEDIATTLNKSHNELLDIFTNTDLFVYMVGFTLGYLYLGDLPEAFKGLSRRADPRTRLDSGAVCTAQGMVVVHSIASPGGLNVIGRTPAPLFDIRNLPPSPFSPGDSITFEQISRTELNGIEQRVADNNYQLDCREIPV